MTHASTSTTFDENLVHCYHTQLGSLVSTAMEKKARNGELPTCPPVGYRIPTYGWPRTPTIDPLLGPLVKEAFEMAATGEYSLREILRVMTTRGLVSRTGNRLGVSALWHILTNPYYAGTIRYKGELLPGRHEPLISQRIFKRAQRSRNA